MLFITYYEISNDVTAHEIIEAGELLMESGMWPPEGMELLRWDTSVNDWGVTIAEADSYEPINRSLLMWEELVPGLFEETRTAPASPVEEAMAQGGALLDELPAQR